MLVNPHVPSKIFQGITTEITGEGNSIAPLNERLLAADSAPVFAPYHLSRTGQRLPSTLRVCKKGNGNQSCELCRGDAG